MSHAKLAKIIESIEGAPTPQHIAEAAWDRIIELGLEQECLMPLLVGYIQMHQRERMRQLERGVLPRYLIMRTEEITKDAPLNTQQLRAKEYLSQTLAFGPSHRMVVAVARKSDWMARRRMLELQRDGTNRTIDTCDRMISLFDNNRRAKTTGELPLDDLGMVLSNNRAA